MMNLSITETNIIKATGDFLTSVVLPNTAVMRGQVNRVPENVGPDFVLMVPSLRSRLATNVDSFSEVQFTGSISGTTMTVSAVAAGQIQSGITLFGAGIAADTVVTGQTSGTPGGIGAYTVSVSQTVVAETISAGFNSALQSTQVDIQLDVHGPNSANNAQIISTVFWDQYAFDTVTNYGFDIAPLYCDDPKQIPFINGEQQYEDRWVINAVLEVNPVVQIPQQFATLLGPVDLVDVI